MSNWYHLYNFFDNPHQSGFLIFILGILFILSLYHFLLYFQHKDKSYLWYSIYTFLIFFSHMYWMESAYTKNLIAPIKPFIDSIYQNLVWGYNMLYFVFAFTFVNLKSYSPKWYKIIFYYLAALCSVMIVIDIVYRISGDIEILRNGDIFFLIAASIIAILGYIPLFKAPVSVKYYIIIGSFVLFATSVLANSMYHFEFGGYSDLRFSIFYTGVIIENLLFSLGLGHRQKIIMDERNRAQEKLIRQLLENENLKMEVENKLHQELELLQSKLEVDKLENLNMQFQKDLAEQKLEALRSHMNPHFIFNSLNSIKRFIIENDQKKAVFYLNKFSKLIRKILSSSISKQVTLAEEIEFSNLYVNIENIRFSNKIIYETEIAENITLNTIKVPSMLLQPFLENAIWHGLSSKKGEKKIKLSVAKDEDMLNICIQDNGIGRENSIKINNQKILKKDSLGIQLTHDRLKTFAKLHSGKFELKINDLKDQDGNPIGTQVIIKFNIHPKEKNQLSASE